MPEICLPPYLRLTKPAGQDAWMVPIEVVTPLYGGGAQTRHVDHHTPVRASAIRGNLRFWWRALFGGGYDSPTALYEQEKALFGGLGRQHQDVVASGVRVGVFDLITSHIEDDDIGLQHPASYALWPARATRDGKPPAERWAPGLRFTLRIELTPGQVGERASRELEMALRAWLLFGGIGGRTRRGCGALAVASAEARSQWLPEGIDAGSLGNWLGLGTAARTGFPTLAGARLATGRPGAAIASWHEAISWLREFRQGTQPSRTDTANAGNFARQRPSMAGGNAGRPGRSRWPEPDLIRHLSGPGPHDHPTLIPAAPAAWPRAQFGLPIQVQFQRQDRAKRPFANRPPAPCSLDWAPDGLHPQGRLASPLIIKPVQTRDNRFVPVALWLRRTLPDTATAGVLGTVPGGDKVIQGGAPIAAMPASPLFSPLTGKISVEDAFMDWLVGTRRLTGGTL